MKPRTWRIHNRNPHARTPHDYELARMTLALRYGTRLPKIEKPKIEHPGFALDRCEYHGVFSPDGKHLLAPSPGRDALWDVDTGEKLVRLNGIVHQHYFSFSPDSKILLARNEQGLFARFAVPSGELIGTCKHAERWSLDGTGTLIPEANLILQLAYEGKLFAMNADTGKIFLRKQLDSTGYSGEVYWLQESQEVLISQSAVSGATSAFWRWRWPLDQNEPERLASNFSGLQSSLIPGKRIILLHHDAGQDAQLDQWDIQRAQIVNSVSCACGIISKPTISFDGKALAVSTNPELELQFEGERHRIKGAKGACFHPTRDLAR